METIKLLRGQIDRIDEQLLQLLGKRLQTSRTIVNLRTSSGGSVRDPKRESVIVKRLQQASPKHGLGSKHIADIWKQIFSFSYSAAIKPLIKASSPLTVAVVGFGRFGRLLNQLLKQHVRNVTIHIHTRITPPKEIAVADIIVLAVPISEIENTVKQLAPHLKKGALVVDICTVKVHPVGIMKRHLPKSVSILATHPTWGPDSVKINHGLAKLTVVLAPIRVSQSLFNLATGLCKQVGLIPIEMSAEDHDKWLAQSLLTTDLVGLVLKEMNFTATPIDTISTTWLHKIVDEFVGNDTPQLLQDMFRFNPFTQSLLKDMATALKRVSQKLQ